jgi:hypothetical protein
VKLRVHIAAKVSGTATGQRSTYRIFAKTILAEGGSHGEDLKVAKAIAVRRALKHFFRQVAPAPLDESIYEIHVDLLTTRVGRVERAMEI